MGIIPPLLYYCCGMKINICQRQEKIFKKKNKSDVEAQGGASTVVEP